MSENRHLSAKQLANRLAIEHAGRRALRRKLLIWVARNALSAAIAFAVVYRWPELDWVWLGVLVFAGVSLVTTVLGHLALQRRIKQLGDDAESLEDIT